MLSGDPKLYKTDNFLFCLHVSLAPTVGPRAVEYTVVIIDIVPNRLLCLRCPQRGQKTSTQNPIPLDLAFSEVRVCKRVGYETEWLVQGAMLLRCFSVFPVLSFC